jgi:hypothetical protein
MAPVSNTYEPSSVVESNAVDSSDAFTDEYVCLDEEGYLDINGLTQITNDAPIPISQSSHANEANKKQLKPEKLVPVQLLNDENVPIPVAEF